MKNNRKRKVPAVSTLTDIIISQNLKSAEFAKELSPKEMHEILKQHHSIGKQDDKQNHDIKVK